MRIGRLKDLPQYYRNVTAKLFLAVNLLKCVIRSVKVFNLASHELGLTHDVISFGNERRVEHPCQIVLLLLRKVDCHVSAQNHIKEVRDRTSSEKIMLREPYH